ncbi:MAG: peptidoglycan DD-metalloendopeptidase family protein [Minisyncoccia bacterium]|jgi:murein DD-endopeptidase MepM/ murein hydrolase activator NlpD
MKTFFYFYAQIVAAVVTGCAIVAITARAQSVSPTSTTTPMTATTLQTQIQQKQQQLNDVNAQLASTTASLKQIQSQRVTLQQQLNLINGNVNSLNLGIQADALTSQQLTLEIDQLQSDMKDIQASVTTKQNAIASILQEVERNDSENGNLLALFLKSGTLADGVLEANSLLNLRAELATDIDALKELNTEYAAKIGDSTAKSDQVTAHQEDLQNKKVIVQDQQTQKQTLLKSTKNQESVFQEQVTALQKEQAAIASDMEAIAAVLRTKIDPSTLPALAPGVLLVPIQGDDESDITQGYGATAFAKNGYAGHWHNGIDLAASIGTPVLAAEDGVVAATGNQDTYCYKGAYGKFVVINHTNNLTTLYGHLSRIIAAKGDTVKRGQIIGYSGQTGYATGPHLHFTVYAQATFYMGPSKVCGPMPYGGDLNPIGYLF